MSNKRLRQATHGMELRGEESESGTATVMIIAVIACMVLIGGTFISANAIRYERTNAQSAADLSALAGANQLLNGTGDPCVTALAVAHANRAEAITCEIIGDSVKVLVHFSRSGFGGQAVSVAGRPATEFSEEY